MLDGFDVHYLMLHYFNDAPVAVALFNITIFTALFDVALLNISLVTVALPNVAFCQCVTVLCCTLKLINVYIVIETEPFHRVENFI